MQFKRMVRVVVVEQVKINVYESTILIINQNGLCDIIQKRCFLIKAVTKDERKDAVAFSRRCRDSGFFLRPGQLRDLSPKARKTENDDRRRCCSFRLLLSSEQLSFHQKLSPSQDKFLLIVERFRKKTLLETTDVL